MQGGDHGGFTLSEKSREIRIIALSVKDWWRHEYKERCYTGVCFVHIMSALFILIFLVYHFYELDNLACHQALKILVNLCLYFAGLTL